MASSILEMFIMHSYHKKYGFHHSTVCSSLRTGLAVVSPTQARRGRLYRRTSIKRWLYTGVSGRTKAMGPYKPYRFASDRRSIRVPLVCHCSPDALCSGCDMHSKPNYCAAIHLFWGTGVWIMPLQADWTCPKVSSFVSNKVSTEQ